MQPSFYSRIAGNVNRSDTRWGMAMSVGQEPGALILRGQNLLGKLLMELRAYLRQR